MDDLEQKKLELILEIMNVHTNFEGEFIDAEDFNSCAKKIISALKQFEPEPFEVEIDDQNYVWFDTYGFETKQEALAWCEKKGLKVRL